MKLTPTLFEGAFEVTPTPFTDERGYFAVAFEKKAFEEAGLATEYIQTNIAHNIRKGTLRGLHSRIGPHQEAKLVQCVQGAIYDVIVDDRPDSPTYRQWIGMELSARNGKLLYIPEGFLHGYYTLTDDTTVQYQVTGEYTPHAEIGVRFDDPALNIEWPGEITVISQKDCEWPLLPKPVKAPSF
ncbi:MAG: dTDP-4-dehydrorhamnose 3,5-epimerase [Candidatus Melainabacteria bacterium]